MKEEYDYDTEGRVSDYTQTIAYRENYPFKTSYLYDTLDRVTDIRYPAQYGLAGSPRRLIQNSYDTASRLTSLKVNGAEQAGDIIYNAADETTSIKIGGAGANQVTENYTFDPQTCRGNRRIGKQKNSLNHMLKRGWRATPLREMGRRQFMLRMNLTAGLYNNAIEH
jgi:hypothetical protein